MDTREHRDHPEHPEKDLNREKSTTPKPDEETLHTTDPQEHMKGPVSSMMHQTGKGFETDETKADAARKHDEKW